MYDGIPYQVKQRQAIGEAVRRGDKNAEDLRPSADGSAVRTSLVAGGGYTAGSQSA